MSKEFQRNGGALPAEEPSHEDCPNMLNERELDRVKDLDTIFFEALDVLDKNYCFHWHHIGGFQGSTLLYAQIDNIGKNVLQASEQLPAWNVSREQYKIMRGFLDTAQAACEEAKEWAKKMPQQPEGLSNGLNLLENLLNRGQNRLGSQLPSNVTGPEGSSPTPSRDDKVWVP